MPDKETLQRAEQDKKEGKSPSTQAGEFVREEVHHIREGKHGARSTKQAIAIGLSKARRAGVKLGVPKKGKASASVRKQAARDLRNAETPKTKTSPKRSRAVSKALKREGRSAASRQSLSRQARNASRKRTSAERHQAAMKAVQTKGSTGRRRAAKNAAKTRSEHRRAA